MTEYINSRTNAAMQEEFTKFMVNIRQASAKKGSARMHAPRVVLVSTRGYDPERDDPLLQELIDSKIELFCAVGIDAGKWEDALDWFRLRQKDCSRHFIVTTAHEDESVEEVIEFAEIFKTSTNGEIEVLYV